jgi:hypothetical protein
LAIDGDVFWAAQSAATSSEKYSSGARAANVVEASGATETDKMICARGA